MIYEVAINGRTRRVDVRRSGEGFIVSVDGRRQLADVTVRNGVWSLILTSDGEASPERRSYEVAIGDAGGATIELHVNGRLVRAAVGTARGSWAGRGGDAAAAATGPQTIAAPMPGKVVRLLVKPGDVVAARQGVVVVEAMKMENELRAGRAGTVAQVKVNEGASVEAGHVLVVIE